MRIIGSINNERWNILESRLRIHRGDEGYSCCEIEKSEKRHGSEGNLRSTSWMNNYSKQLFSLTNTRRDSVSNEILFHGFDTFIEVTGPLPRTRNTNHLVRLDIKLLTSKCKKSCRIR